MENDLKQLAHKAGTLLRSQKLLLVTAESCTGGWLAQCITDIAGSSAWFERGFITYSNASKQEMLGVREKTLNASGAVSEATVSEMVLGALGNSRADVSVAISGIAGPDGATPDKPVGTVCIAWARKERQARCVTRWFDGDRASVRRQAVLSALEGLIDDLEP